MLTSYEVGAVFRIADQATPTLLKLSAEMQRLEKLALGLKTAFDRIGSAKVGNMTGSLAKISGELTQIERKAIVTGDALMNGVGKASGVISGAATKAELLRKELAASVAEANNLAKIKAPNLGNPRPGGGGGGGGGGGIHQRRPGGHGGRHAIGEAGLTLGIFGSIGFHETGHAIHEMYDKRKEWEHTLLQMQIAGFDKDAHTGKTGQLEKAGKAAIGTGFKYGINRTQVLEDIKELVMPFGSVDHAIEFIDPLEKMRVVLNAVTHGKGNEARDSVFQMARAGELKGLIEAGDYNKYFDSMTKSIVASGGKITPKSFAQVTQYGKLASFGWSEEFYTKYLPTLMQTMNPSTAGQSLMSLFSTMGGTAKGDAVKAMNELGLIGDPSKLKFNKKGDITGMTRGAVDGTDLFNTNPLEWARQYLLPRLEEKFGSLDKAENKEKAIGYMGTIFGNRNSAAAAAELALRMKSFDRDHALISGAQGTSAAGTMLDKDPKTVEAKLKAAWDNFLTMMGGPAVEAAISSMNALASGLNTLTKWGDEHPTGVKVVIGALMGLGGALLALSVAGVVAGAMLLGPGGAVVVAITTVIGVLSGIVATNWDAATKAFSSFWDYMKSWVEWLKGLGSHAAGSGGNGPGEGVVPSRIPMSYEGPAFGGGAGIIKAAFGGSPELGGDSGDERFAKCVYVGVLAALREFGGGGGGGFGGGGAGFHRASLGGGGGFTGGFGGGGSWGGKALAVGSGTGIGHVASQADRAAYIRAKAAELGIDPEVALRVAQSEGFNSYVGDQGRSFGDWQLFTGGGLGNAALAAGINIRDPSTWKAQTDFALKYARQHGWGSWYGAGRVGIGNMVGIGGPASVINGQVRIKAGAGSASGPLAAFAEQLSKGGGVDRFTAFNDAYHAGTGSMHAKGLAADVTGDPDKIMANARAMMEAVGLKEGRDFKMIDEYRHKSRRWTGGHVHFQFETPEAAEAYARAQRGSVPPTAGAPPKPGHDKVVSIPVHIGGHKVAHVMHRVMTAHATFPTSAGVMDSHGQYRSPGTRTTDTA